MVQLVDEVVVIDEKLKSRLVVFNLTEFYSIDGKDFSSQVLRSMKDKILSVKERNQGN